MRLDRIRNIPSRYYSKLPVTIGWNSLQPHTAHYLEQLYQNCTVQHEELLWDASISQHLEENTLFHWWFQLDQILPPAQGPGELKFKLEWRKTQSWQTNGKWKWGHIAWLLALTTASSIPLELTRLLGLVGEVAEEDEEARELELLADTLDALARFCLQASATTRRHSCWSMELCFILVSRVSTSQADISEKWTLLRSLWVQLTRWVWLWKVNLL